MRCLLPVALLPMLAAACGSPEPALELILYERAVSCDGQGCRDEAGLLLPGEQHRVPVRVSRANSAFAPRGLRLETRLRRPGGVLATLEIDVPIESAATVTAAPVVRYQELDAERRTLFSAARASGRFEVGGEDSCPCQTGRLELLLTDAGPDGTLDTSDDRVRQLSQARVRIDARPFCHGRAALPIRPGLLLIATRACPARTGNAAAPAACAWGAGGWTESGWNDDGWFDPGWTGEWSEGWDDGWDSAGEPVSDEWGDDGWDDGTGDDGWYDGGWYDDGWDDGGWDDDGWTDDSGGWEDDGWDEWDDSSGGWDDGSDWTDDDWL